MPCPYDMLLKLSSWYPSFFLLGSTHLLDGLDIRGELCAVIHMCGHSLDAVPPKKQLLQFPLLWHRMKFLSATGWSPPAGALLPCVRVSRLQYNLASLKASRKKWVTVIMFLDLCMSF